MGTAASSTASTPAPAASLRRLLPLLTLSALSGGAIAVSFPPLDVWPIAYVAFAPLLVAVCRAPSWRSALLCAGVAALAAYLPAFAWVASVAVPGWVGLAVYVGLYLLVAALLARLFQRRAGAAWPVAAAAAWAALELTRARLGPGFPWLFLGYTQHKFLPLVQVAAVGGVYAVSFLVFLVNAALAQLGLALCSSGARTGRPAALLVLGASLAAVGACAGVGRAVMGGLPVSEGPVVGVVQQNIPRIVADIFDPTKTAEQIYREREDEVLRCAMLTARLRGQGVALVAWPESTAPVPLDLPARLFAIERERLLQEQTLGLIRALGAEMDCFFLVGAPSYVSREVARSLLYGVEATAQFGNGAVLLSPEAVVEERYDKIRLVPFGEYIPLREQLPFLQKFTPLPREITPGTEEVVFALPLEGGGKVRFAALICYEDVFPELCASFRRRGAEFLVNLTDEGWYVIPGELRQHLAMAVFRAVETRTTLVRAANTGISCFIGPTGEVYAALEPLTEGALAAPVRLCPVRTAYVRRGDAFGWSCVALTAALLGVLLLARRARS